MIKLIIGILIGVSYLSAPVTAVEGIEYSKGGGYCDANREDYFYTVNENGEKGAGYEYSSTKRTREQCKQLCSEELQCTGFT